MNCASSTARSSIRVARQPFGLLVKTLSCAVVCLGVVGCSAPEVSDPVTVKPASNVEERVAVNSESSLSASISTANPSVAVGEPVLVDFKLENTSSADIKILPWNTPLESRLSADVFTVLRDGSKVLFVGRKIRRPEATEADYVTLAPGEVLENTVDLALSYNLAKPGVYSVQYTPVEISGVASFNVGMPISVAENILTIELK